MRSPTHLPTQSSPVGSPNPVDWRSARHRTQDLANEMLGPTCRGSGKQQDSRPRLRRLLERERVVPKCRRPLRSSRGPMQRSAAPFPFYPRLLSSQTIPLRPRRVMVREQCIPRISAAVPHSSPQSRVKQTNLARPEDSWEQGKQEKRSSGGRQTSERVERGARPFLEGEDDGPVSRRRGKSREWTPGVKVALSNGAVLGNVCGG